MKSAKSDNRPLKRSQSDLADRNTFGGRVAEALGERTMAWLSGETGISTSMLSDYRRGKTPGSDKAVKIADALGVSVRWLVTGEDDPKVLTEVRGAGPVGAEEVRDHFFGGQKLKPLPLYGSAIGGEFGEVDEHIELTELNLTEVLDYLARPTSLANDRDAYALTVVGDSMEPRFRPGEQVAVSPRSPISIGDDVIVQLRAEETDDDRVRMVLIKQLVRRTSTHVELRQYNPAHTFRVDAKRIAAMHKVKGHFL
jgi:phage repressor protein C with HTH and peptisase S24 domain